MREELVEEMEYELDAALVRAKSINDKALINSLSWCLEIIEEHQDETRAEKRKKLGLPV
jgi:hypothetical protein